MKTSHTTRLAVLAAVAAAVLVVASPAMASGVTGGFSAGSGYCWEPDLSTGVGNHEILATAPIISPAETSGFATGGGQLVAFAAMLQRWNGSAWVANQTSPLYRKTAAYGFDGGEWLDTYRGTWGHGLTRFRITQTGFYRLRYDYFWFNSNEYVTGHTWSLSWGLRDDRLSSLTTTVWKYVDWCQY